MRSGNRLMTGSDWKKRCEATLLSLATVVQQWSSARAERKRLTHTMFKVRKKLEEVHALQGMPEGKPRVDALWCLQTALEMTFMDTAAIGKKAAKKEGLVL